MEDVTAGGSTVDSLVDVAGTRLAVTSGGTLNWLLPDLHGNVAGQLDSSGSTITYATRYDPWGEIIDTGPGANSGTAGRTWTYQGRLDVSPAGIDQPLLDGGARLYAPALGTFTSLDSVAGTAQDPLSMNRYLYAEANPATFIDPTGHGVCQGWDEDCYWLTGQSSTPAAAKAATHNNAPSCSPNCTPKPGPSTSGSNSPRTTVRNTEWQISEWDAGVDFNGQPQQVLMNYLDHECVSRGNAEACELRDPKLIFGPSELDQIGAAVDYYTTFGFWHDYAWRLPNITGNGQDTWINLQDTANTMTLIASLASGAKLVTELPGLARSGYAGIRGLLGVGKATAGIRDLELRGAIGQIVGAACSFAAATTVATPDGMTPISTIQPGDTVTAADPATGTVADHTVTDVDVHSDPEIEYLHLDGETIETTPNHRFLTDHGWVEAAALYPGTKVEKLDGTTGTVEGYSIEVRPVIMYDLTVSDVHTFAVGEGQWIVHNAGPCDIKVPSSFHGATMQEARDAVPDSWGTGTPTIRDGGTRWFDPGTKGSDGIRIMPGVPSAVDPFHQGPYVVINIFGVPYRIPLAGNPILGGRP